MKTPGSPRGTTLLELTVVLVLLGLIAGLAGGTLRTTRSPRRTDSLLLEARRRAVRTGTPVKLHHGNGWILLLPDGQARGQGVDPLTGSPVPPP